MLVKNHCQKGSLACTCFVLIRTFIVFAPFPFVRVGLFGVFRVRLVFLAPVLFLVLGRFVVVARFYSFRFDVIVPFFLITLPPSSAVVGTSFVLPLFIFLLGVTVYGVDRVLFVFVCLI